jgi:hypothetical protein
MVNLDLALRIQQTEVTGGYYKKFGHLLRFAISAFILAFLAFSSYMVSMAKQAWPLTSWSTFLQGPISWLSIWAKSYLNLKMPPRYSSLQNLHMLPPSLGVTKEIMSRGPQVADMECRESD